MFDLAFASSSERDAEPALAPARALLTPTWILALALLVANDHWLKGSGLMPGVLTGKLSDFAGMIVAPVLLATLLRVRSRRALLACHVAVGAVFAGIQLSPAFAAQWSALMGVFGHPWTITCDPTDLIALPFLGLAWALLVPEMDASRPALIPLQRSAVAALSVFGLWSTVATSDVEGDIDFDDEWYEDVVGNLFINNANEHDIALFVRELRTDVQLDCLQVSLDPGRMLRPELFADAEHWLLPARTNVGLQLTGGQACSALWIAGEGIDPTIVFVESLASFPSQQWNGQDFDPNSLPDAGLALVFDATGSEWIGGEMIRFTPRQDNPELPESCESPVGESRLDWSPIAQGEIAELETIEPGLDGCYELQLQTMIAQGEFAEAQPWYLCAPESAVPFTPGELLQFTTVFGNAGGLVLEVALLDPETLGPAVDEAGEPVRTVHYFRAQADTKLITSVLERSLIEVPSVGCPWQVEDGCGTVERPIELALEGSQAFLSPGEAVSFETETAVLSAVATYARERSVVDPNCSEGALRLSYDIDFALIERAL